MYRATQQRYRDEILRPHVLTIMRNFNVIYQHGNSRPHVAMVTLAYLQSNAMQISPCSSKSPNLNPFEYVWVELDIRVRHASHNHRLLYSWHKQSKRSGMPFPNVWFVILLIPWVEDSNLFSTSLDHSCSLSLLTWLWVNRFYLCEMPTLSLFH